MNKFSLLIAFVIMLSVACQQDNKSTADGAVVASESGATIKFDKDVFEFGEVNEGEQVEHEFKFENTGKTPLIITNATATCGCTIPEWPKEPIKPGDKGVIKVIFNSLGKPGLNDKVITITSNANPAQTLLHIIGEVKTVK
ncbi:MAG: DUF1573 domain-containing protein [Pedobacter sp.]|nr:MAG: DUF1573 domain-containing protein [Pedobacter sp.]